VAKSTEGLNEDRPLPVSAFLGRPLAAVAGIEDPVSAKLSAVGISDAEQLVAIAAVAGARDYLAAYLGVPRQTVDTLVKQARKVVPAYNLSLIEEPLPPLFGLGALEPTPEMQAQGAAVPAPPGDAPLPSSTNLIDKMSPIRFQGMRSTCVAFTLTALNEYVRRVNRSGDDDLSEQHLYYESKLIDGDSRPGTWQLYASRVLAGTGECRESVWPYNPNPPDTPQGPSPANARTDARNYRLQLQQLSTKSVVAIKSSVASGKPVGISFPVYSTWYNSAETRRSGRITLRVGNEPRAGGHAVCLVGYQDDSSTPGGGYFILRNSWGTTWGAQSPYGPGYGTIPYQYIAVDNDEAYTLKDDIGPPHDIVWKVLFSAQLDGNASHRWYQEGWDANVKVDFRVKNNPPDSTYIDMTPLRFVEADGSVTYYFNCTNRSASTIKFDIEYGM
jgi:hypothetical protein